ncbi:MAG: FHA domain-containing protein [Acidobacteria bacterium]|nr:FHA domain-containing protein [Acidobacteriota bacterium]
MKICPQCKADNDAGYRYCRDCGHALADVPVNPSDSGMELGAEPSGVDTRQTLAYRREGTPLKAWLHRITSAKEREEPYELKATMTKVGRETGDLLLPADVFLSSPHAKFYFDKSLLWVEDMGSANGSFVRIGDRTPLAFGDTVVVGHQALRLDDPDEVLESASTGTTDGELQTAAYGRPAADYVACLSALLADGTVGSRYLLDSRDWVLGRERGDIVFARDDYVSNDHAVIRYVAGRHEVEDLGSENGTFMRVDAPRALREGDAVMLGRQVFVVRFE